jgi:hypothetical protein
MPRVRKSSTRITLVLIGAAGLTACSSDVEQRDIYASREDCREEWRNPAADDTDDPCEEFSSGGRSYYYGPRYSSARRGPGGTVSSLRSNSKAISFKTTGGGFGSSSSGSTVQRGGFGSSSSWFSGGG